MRAIFKYIIILGFLPSCGEETPQAPGETKPAHEPVQVVDLNTNQGYNLNQLSNDTIQAIFTQKGDTIKTGIPIPARGKKIHPDSITKPFTRKAGTPVKTLAHKNIHHISKEIQTIELDIKSLHSTTLNEDNIEKKEVKGKKFPVRHPQPVIALSPGYKDNAVEDLQYLDVDHGLNSSYIRDLLEDKNGNIWLATDGGGVTKYDGNSFSTYTTKNGLSNNRVFSILEDQKGNLWFGTYGGGVMKYNGHSFVNYTKNDGLGSNNIFALTEDKQGQIWFGTEEGIAKKDGSTISLIGKDQGFTNTAVLCIEEDKKGNMWFGTKGEGIVKFDGLSFTYIPRKEGLNNDVIWAIQEDSKGNMWFGSFGGGLSKFNGNSITNYTKEEGLSHNRIFSILEDEQGNIWAATDGGGVCKFDGKAFTHFTKKSGLNTNLFRALMEDSYGNLWFGGFGGGLVKYDQNSFRHFTKKQGLSNNIIWSVAEDDRNNLWFGTYGGGLTKYDEKFFYHYAEKQGLSNNYIRSSMKDSNGNMWFGTYGGGVCKYDGNYFTNYTKKSGLSNNFVLSMLEDRQGNIWFGTDGGGLNRYDGKSFTHYTTKQGLSNNKVFSMLEDKNNNLWLATYGGGVTKYDGENFTHYTEREGLSNNNVFSIMEDQTGRLWLGTYGGGLNKFDGKEFTYYSEKQGLSSNSVVSVLKDDNENIWLGTEKGISVLLNKPKGELEILNLASPDGLKGLDFHIGSAFSDSKNRAWWGSGKALTMLDLNKFKIADHTPSLQLNYLEINDKFIDYRNINDSLGNEISFNSVPAFKNYPEQLELPYQLNELTFHFSAIDWKAPHKIKYSYSLEGLHDNWTAASKETKVRYRNLSHGTYTFKVRATGESGKWSNPFTYTFTIHPPWWHTWWARTSYVLIGLILIFGFVQWRTGRLKRRQKELERKISNATKEIREQKEEVEGQKNLIEKAHYQLEEKNREIMDSISYAKRIQSAILPPQKLVKEYLSNSFILYKPKDIVAGDFYWMEQQKNKILFSAADCTGHGVPGAMVSVVCNNGLNRSVREYGLTDPGKILDKTREIVIREFEKSEEDVKDGMDLALCSLHTQTQTLHYSGAHNPLWIVCKKGGHPELIESGARLFHEDEGDYQLIEIKADKQPIGKFGHKKPFTTHEVQLEKGDSIYIFSDGFVDQFGGKKGKKFKAVNFKRLLVSIQDQSPEKQRDTLDHTFENWKGDLDQLDDVCVIGVKV